MWGGLFTARHQSRPTVLVLRGGEVRADALLLERLLSLRGPERQSPLALVASELIGHPEQCDVVSTLRPLSARYTMLHFDGGVENP